MIIYKNVTYDKVEDLINKYDLTKDIVEVFDKTHLVWVNTVEEPLELNADMKYLIKVFLSNKGEAFSEGLKLTDSGYNDDNFVLDFTDKFKGKKLISWEELRQKLIEKGELDEATV